MPEGPRGCVRLGTSYGGYWKLRGAGAGPQGESAEPTRSLPRPSAPAHDPGVRPLAIQSWGGWSTDAGASRATLGLVEAWPLPTSLNAPLPTELFCSKDQAWVYIWICVCWGPLRVS